MKDSIIKPIISFALLIVLFHNGVIAQATSRKVLGLQDCIGMALEKSTTVLKGNNNIAFAGTQVLAAYGQFLPNLVAGAGINYDRGNNFYSTSSTTLVNSGRSQYNYQLTSSINIFSGYYNYASWKSAQLNEKVAGMTLERAKQQIQLDITQAYLQVLLDKKIVALDSNNLSTSLKREDQLTVLTQIGRRAKTDLYQQQAQTSNDKLQLINATSKMQNDKVLLLQRLRIDSTDSYEIADMPIDDKTEADYYNNEQTLVQQALQNRIDIKYADFVVQSADWNVKRYKSGYLPQVNLAGGLYNNGAYFDKLVVNGVDEKPASQEALTTQLYKYTYGYLGVNATWNLFDKYFTKSNVAVAKIDADNARIDLQDTKISVVATVKQAHNDYINAVQQIETVGKGLEAARNAYDAVDGKYKEGATDFITESNSQLVLLQAQQNKIQASINMMLQKKIIDFYTGK